MAVVYIVLSLITAVIFILTRNAKVDIKKRDFLIIKVDLTFFAIELINREKRKNKRKDKADAKSPELYRKIKDRIVLLLSVSRLEIRKLSLPIFPASDLPSALPFLFGNRAINLALSTYLLSLAKEGEIVQGSSTEDDVDDLVYHFILYTPLIRLIYTIAAVRLDTLKDKKRKRLSYVGN